MNKQRKWRIVQPLMYSNTDLKDKFYKNADYRKIQDDYS